MWLSALIRNKTRQSHLILEIRSSYISIFLHSMALMPWNGCKLAILSFLSNNRPFLFGEPVEVKDKIVDGGLLG